jgi:hypothetical protein
MEVFILIKSQTTISKRLFAFALAFAVAVSMGTMLVLPANAHASAPGDHHSNDQEFGGGFGGGMGGGFGGGWSWNGSNNGHDSDNGEDADEQDEDFDDDGELAIEEDPESAVYAVGNFAEDLEVELSGDDSGASFQWYSNTTDSSDGASAISGATGAVLSGDDISTAATGTTYYYCIIETGSGETLTSDTAEITVKELAITAQPKSGSYKVGKSLKLKVGFVGNGDVQWYSSSDGETWTAIDGADRCAYKPNTKNEGTMYYRAVVTNGLDEDAAGYASLTSDKAKIVISGTADNANIVGKLKYRISGTSAVVAGTSKRTYSSLVIPDTVTINGTIYNVTSIGAGAFCGCQKLRNVTVGTNVASIGAKAFLNCHRLRTVTFSGTALTTVGSRAFARTARSLQFNIPTEQLAAYQALLEDSGAMHNAKYLAY